MFSEPITRNKVKPRNWARIASSDTWSSRPTKHCDSPTPSKMDALTILDRLDYRFLVLHKNTISREVHRPYTVDIAVDRMYIRATSTTISAASSSFSTLYRTK